MKRIVGRYFDGASARSTQARMALGENGLSIIDDDGAVLARWRYRTLRLAEPWRSGGGPARFLEAGGDARLVVDDDAGVRAIFAHAPQLRGGRDRDLRPKFIAAIAAGMALFLFAAALALDYAAPRIAKALLTPDAARAYGDQIANAMVGPSDDDGAYCRDDAAQAALNALTARLLAAIDAPADLVQVDIANLKPVNAFALPGGRILMLRGLLEDAGSAEVVAGVLAHEIGHALERHPVEGLGRAFGVQLVTLLLAPGDGVDIAAKATLSAYSRAAEIEADDWALRILTAADIDARPLGGFFTRLAGDANDDSAERPSLFSTHPHAAERAKRFTRAGGPAMSAEAWAALQAACANAPDGRAPFGGLF